MSALPRLVRRLTLVSLLALLPHSAPAADVEPRPDVPWITARTVKTAAAGKDDALASVAVEVQLRFGRPPAGDYELQGFFVVRDPDSKERVIYDAVRLVSADQTLARTLTSKAPPRPAWFELPPEITPEAEGADEPTPSPAPVEIPPGARVEGWIVRVLSAGKVVRLEANQPALGDWARKSPESLDERARSARDLAAAE